METASAPRIRSLARPATKPALINFATARAGQLRDHRAGVLEAKAVRAQHIERRRFIETTHATGLARARVVARNHDRHLAQRRGLLEAGREFTERTADRLLMSLRQLAHHDGGACAAESCGHRRERLR